VSERDLDELVWHWGEAYIFTKPRPDLWLAERRDDHGTLHAKTAPELLDKIRADYFSHPVSRRISRPEVRGGTRSGRGSRFPPEG
jgi:hypothetical protein